MLKAKNKRVTLKDIAQRAGVSATVVSQVLRGAQSPMVSENTRNRVIEIARELGYRPNRHAQALVGGKTYTVALWKHDLHSAFHAWVLHQLTLSASNDGYEVIVCNFASVQEDIHRMLATGVDGVVAHECVEHVKLLLRSYEDRRLPLVSMGVFYVSECDHVGIDLYTPAREAVKHLYDVGCRRIAYVLDDPSRAQGEPRYEAYTSVMQEAGLPAEYLPLHGASRAEVRRLVKEYIQEHGVPDGLLCHNDDTAITCLRALYDLGLRVPDDVALVGCDGIEETLYTCPEISTIVQPVEAMCRTGWELLRRRMEQPDAELQSVILPARLEVRESSRR